MIPTFVLAYLASAAALLLPGALLLAAARGRDRWALVLYAPLVSVAVVGGLAVVLPWLGVPFGAGTVAAGTVALAAAVAVASRAVRPRPVPPRVAAAAPGTRRALAAAFAGAGIAWAWQLLGPLERPDEFVQPYDVPWHMAIVRRIVTEGDGSSLTAALVDATEGAQIYPAAWHDLVALVVGLTGASVPLAINANVLAIVTIAWPLSLVAFAAPLLGRRPLPLAAVVLLGAAFQAFPLRFVLYGVLYSNLLAYAILPAALAAALALWGERAGRVRAAAVCAVGLVALGLAQPNAVFTAATLLLPFAVTRLWLAVRRAAGRAGRAAPWIAAAACAAFLVAVAAAWRALHDAEALHRTVAFDWPPFEGPRRALWAAAAFAFNGQPPQYLAGALVAAGAVVALRSRRHAWLVAAHAVMCLFYVVTASTKNDVRDVLTGFWYHDSNRLAAAAVLTAVPLAALGIEAIAALGRRVVPSARRSLAWLPAAVAVAVAVAAGPALDPALAAQRETLASMAGLDSGGPLTAAEDAFLARAAQDLPPGAVVANLPYDGSTYAYPLHGIDVAFRSYEANWIGPPLADSVLIRDHLRDAATDPRVCAALERRGIGYALVLPVNGVNVPSPAAFIGYGADHWHGLEITPGTAGFEPVRVEGPMALYRITACG